MESKLTQDELTHFNKDWLNRCTKPISMLFAALAAIIIGTHMYFWLVVGSAPYGVSSSHIKVSLLASFLLICSMLLWSGREVIKQRFFRQVCALCALSLGLTIGSVVS